MNELATPDKFARLSAQELEDSFTAAKAEDTGELVCPIPADAPEPAAIHPELGTPSKVWLSRDASGATVFYVCRFETADGKEFRPLSLWRGANGSNGAGKAFPSRGLSIISTS
jgi:hypothetical protein